MRNEQRQRQYFNLFCIAFFFLNLFVLELIAAPGRRLCFDKHVARSAGTGAAEAMLERFCRTPKKKKRKKRAFMSSSVPSSPVTPGFSTFIPSLSNEPDFGSEPDAGSPMPVARAAVASQTPPMARATAVAGGLPRREYEEDVVEFAAALTGNLADVKQMHEKKQQLLATVAKKTQEMAIVEESVAAFNAIYESNDAGDKEKEDARAKAGNLLFDLGAMRKVLRTLEGNLSDVSARLAALCSSVSPVGVLAWLVKNVDGVRGLVSARRVAGDSVGAHAEIEQEDDSVRSDTRGRGDGVGYVFELYGEDQSVDTASLQAMVDTKRLLPYLADLGKANLGFYFPPDLLMVVRRVAADVTSTSVDSAVEALSNKKVKLAGTNANYSALAGLVIGADRSLALQVGQVVDFKDSNMRLTIVGMLGKTQLSLTEVYILAQDLDKQHFYVFSANHLKHWVQNDKAELSSLSSRFASVEAFARIILQGAVVLPLITHDSVATVSLNQAPFLLAGVKSIFGQLKGAEPVRKKLRLAQAEAEHPPQTGTAELLAALVAMQNQIQNMQGKTQ